MFKNKIWMLAAALIMPFCVCVAGMGQATSGSVSGTVHDASGAVVPGATVTISDVAKGTKSV
ncbi:MAG TPA: carboxypeptidase-like regulatory domain-containing protein, partial [Terracidiphilus sp.]|nr:carboxypeptidase-like regulatory domain-containing protein [Terracidiphilus sp.]